MERRCEERDKARIGGVLSRNDSRAWVRSVRPRRIDAGHVLSVCLHRCPMLRVVEDP